MEQKFIQGKPLSLSLQNCIKEHAVSEEFHCSLGGGGRGSGYLLTLPYSTGGSLLRQLGSRPCLSLLQKPHLAHHLLECGPHSSSKGTASHNSIKVMRVWKEHGWAQSQNITQPGTNLRWFPDPYQALPGLVRKPFFYVWFQATFSQIRSEQH